MNTDKTTQESLDKKAIDYLAKDKELSMMLLLLCLRIAEEYGKIFSAGDLVYDEDTIPSFAESKGLLVVKLTDGRLKGTDRNNPSFGEFTLDSRHNWLSQTCRVNIIYLSMLLKKARTE